MKIKIKLKYVRISPRKIAYLGQFLRGKNPEKAISLLKIEKSPKKRHIFEKLIESAMAAAKDRGANEKSLIIKSLEVGQGPALKRRVILSRGRADIIKKRSSHIYLTLVENKKKPKTKKSGAGKSINQKSDLKMQNDKAKIKNFTF